MEFRHIVVIAIRTTSDDFGDDSLLDTLEVLTLLELHLVVVVAELDVGAVVSAGDVASEAARVGSGAGLAGS